MIKTVVRFISKPTDVVGFDDHVNTLISNGYKFIKRECYFSQYYSRCLCMYAELEISEDVMLDLETSTTTQ